MEEMINTYRVWMQDGYASIQSGENEDEAKASAVKLAQDTIAGCAMTPREKRLAVTVDYAEKLSN